MSAPSANRPSIVLDVSPVWSHEIKSVFRTVKSQVRDKDPIASRGRYGEGQLRVTL